MVLMNPIIVLALALLAAVADLVVILTWLKIEPQHIFSGKWWSMPEISISRGRVATILGMSILSLTLAVVGLGILYFHLQFVPPKVVMRGVAIPPSQTDIHQFTLRVFFINTGTLSVTESKHGEILKLNQEELAIKDEERLRKISLESAKNAEVNNNEIVPNDPTGFFDVVDKGISQQDIQDVLAQKQRLYFSVVLKYRDENTPRGKYGITETCGYFYGTLGFFAQCKGGGNRTYVASE